MTLYDRDEELEALRTALESPDHEFYVVYGCRRMGKTELLEDFCADRPHVYFLAAQEAETRQREKFVREVADHFDDRVPRIDGWNEAFDYLGERLATERRILVVDEFPYLVEENDSLASRLRDETAHVRWGPDTRGEEFVLFSKSGFVDGLADDLDDDWSLVDLAEIGTYLSDHPYSVTPQNRHTTRHSPPRAR